MLKNRLLCRTAGKTSRGGFTLVELLVVIGIIAILAGVALGPITAGIKKASQSAGVQTCRTLGLSEFQYANDNQQAYPFGSDASVIAKLLLSGSYINDPGIFYIGGSAESKYTGTTASTSIPVTSISYDFYEQSATAGLNSNTPDQVPVVTSCISSSSQTVATSGAWSPTTITSASPFGTAGVAAAYKSNSAKFVIASTSGTTTTVKNLTDASMPTVTAITAPGGG